MKRAVITGATGFIGRHLIDDLLRDDWSVTALSRNARKAARALPEAVTCLDWDGKSTEGWGHAVDGADAMINLAGENVAGGRWSEGFKERILRSRIDAGTAVRAAIAAADQPPAVLLQASASGFYGSRGDERLDETSDGGEGFLADVVHQWEEVVAPVAESGVRLVYLRTGVVLGEHDGMIDKLRLPFLFFGGGHPGDGRQWLSWIHILDEIRAMRFLLDDGTAEGIYNLVAPDPVRMADFCQAFGDRLSRPSWFHQPEWLLRAVFGEMADDTLLVSQRIAPVRLQDAGFRFQFPEIRSALDNLLG